MPVRQHSSKTRDRHEKHGRHDGDGDNDLEKGKRGTGTGHLGSYAYQGKSLLKVEGSAVRVLD